MLPGPPIRASLGRSCQFVHHTQMDRTDLKILAILQQDASLSVAEVAGRVNLSQTPCWRRIQKLEAAGVIERRVALLNAESVGLGLSVFVEIETGDHSGEWIARFAASVQAMPEVMEVYRMAGDVDYLLRVAVGSMGEYDDFYRRLIAEVPLKNVTSRFAMERVKHTTAYPLKNGDSS
jgi:Lrp/AsnC family transcriptional regulator